MNAASRLSWVPARIISAVVAMVALVAVAAAQPKYVEPTRPAKDRVAGVKVGPPPATTTVTVPMITWGGDAATLLANGGTTTTPASAFGKAGLNVKLAKQDDFVVQVRDYVEGRSPFLRGTVGMINTYSELLNADARTAPVVILQLTWSSGGDCLVVRDGIATPADLRGRTIVLQQYGPHMEYMDKVLSDAGLAWSDVTIKFAEEFFDANGAADDPASIFRAAPDVAACFVISPEAAALTSNMTVGTGAEGSVKGARVLLSTKTANRVIADVYAVRADFFDANKAWVEKFTRAHLDAQQQATAALGKPGSPENKGLVRMAAEFILDSPDATADAEGLLADCTFAQASGNADFFTNTGNLAGFDASNRRNQSWLVTNKFVTAQQRLRWAGWDYAAFGVKGAGNAPRVEFKREEAQKAAAAAPSSNVLFEFEINFEPNQREFNAAQYGAQFQRALELASTYGGAILEIVGHSDHYEYLRLKIKEKASDEVLARQWQSGMNLSLSRANGVRDALIAYGRDKGITLNESQFIATGRGYADPKIAKPMGTDDLDKNRRVQFRVINIEAESSTVFEPLF